VITEFAQTGSERLGANAAGLVELEDAACRQHFEPVRRVK
jgi:hypothetical protein